MTAQIATAEEALALVARCGVVMLVPEGELPSLVAAITGGPIRGSWWSHPDGQRIFTLATALEESDQVLVGKLVAGKVAFVHRRLWPALVRVVTDAGWRKPRIAALSPAAAALLAEVEARGEVDGATPAARKPLEAAALVHSWSEHTERGHHATTLASWFRWAPPEVARAARAMTMAEATAALAAVGVDSASPPKPARAAKQPARATVAKAPPRKAAPRAKKPISKRKKS